MRSFVPSVDTRLSLGYSSRHVLFAQSALLYSRVDFGYGKETNRHFHRHRIHSSILVLGVFCSIACSPRCFYRRTWLQSRHLVAHSLPKIDGAAMDPSRLALRVIRQVRGMRPIAIMHILWLATLVLSLLNAIVAIDAGQHFSIV